MTREHNGADNRTFSATRIHRPASVAELCHIVARAPRVRAIGARHAVNGVAASPGELVELGGIDPDFVMDHERRTVTLGAGTNYAVLAMPSLICLNFRLRGAGGRVRILAGPRRPSQRNPATLAAALAIRVLAQRTWRKVMAPIPAATLRPVLPSMLTGCNEIVRLEPPISTLAPAPTPTVALAVAPA